MVSMENPYDNDESAGVHHGIPTTVTNSPTSLSTTDIFTVRVTESEPENNGATIVTTATNTTNIGIIGSSRNSNTASDSNIDTTASVITDNHTNQSISVSTCPIRASGQVCICDLCETSRLQLLHQHQRHGNTIMNKKKLRHIQEEKEVEPVISTKRLHHNVRTQATTSSDQDASTGRNKRARAAFKYEDNDDDNNDDDNVAHCDIPASSTSIIHRHKEDTIATTIAVTEVVTTAPTKMVVHHSTNKHHENDDDTESQKLRIMSQACRTILQCIGEDPDREGLQKTPERWAKALLYLCHGYHLSPSQVTNNAVFYENHNEMVVVRNIDIHSLCEHHMVPFTGHVHIGYIPNGKIIGLSKLARLADLFARRLQVQERLTRQIADAILETITPLGVAVVMECTHYCMVMRGVQKTGTITTTSSVRGCFETNSKTRAEFFSILHGGGK